ncbi:glycosyl transferase [Chloroflexus islandicus]|uniref:Glycosyl transferase n=1 Tax=Chloroflexus islandicus TaxID=1707952 RepID=A0A178M8Z9_9CHLR|nr:glycosyltransferase family A protein [Chloroflexus islandicus]OAN45261.1 glycosyl transferase [Chloroflexus islandicus]
MRIPTVSAVICTRNRGESAVVAVESILANDHPAFELIVIDQSTDTTTATALRRFQRDRRLRYIATATKGLGIARNIGLQLAHGPLVAFTDDDCRVPANWLRVIEEEFQHEPQAAVLFCNVLPGPHDASAGFIPAYQRQQRTVVKSFLGKCRARGIGAGMAVRRDPVLAIGGFDEALGAGGKFPSAEDADIALRAIAHGWYVIETPATYVIHDGFRTWAEARELAARDWEGLGAAYIKPLKAGHWRAVVVLGYELLVPALLEPLLPLLRLRRPRGLGRLVALIRGCVRGLAHSVDRERLVYRSIAATSTVERLL